MEKLNAHLGDELLWHIRNFYPELKNGLETEYRFHKIRRWRFDICWPSYMIAVECDGMVWQAGGGRHNTDKDREKINTAVSMGWRVLRFSGNQIKKSPLQCIDYILDTFKIHN